MEGCGLVGYARRTDVNHSAIVDALRAAGWHVHDVSGLPGFVDLVVAKGRRLELVEVKAPKGKVNPKQASVHAAFLAKGITVKVLRDIQDAVRL
jgi:hypothetical protein